MCQDSNIDIYIFLEETVIKCIMIVIIQYILEAIWIQNQEEKK